ncbi:MAG: hypothetical protein IT371_09480 [Deltaproteobacteria bacterium]|nr:hypothetical protein [Deltaproteobacteria bacterium]
MSSLRVTREQRADGSTFLIVAGAIDERADLERLFSNLDGRVVMNLKGIERLNSLGIHRWVPLMDELTGRAKVELEALSVPLVTQATVVANLLGTARLTSCMAPYFCPLCQDGRMILVTVEDLRAAGGTSPHKSCPECNGPMELDELDSYLTLLRSEL